MLMACLDGASNFVCVSAGTKARAFPPSDGTRLRFCNWDIETKRRFQTSVKHQFEAVASLQVEVDGSKSNGCETDISTRSSDRRRTGRARRFAGLRQNALLTSSFWLAPQGVVDNRVKQFLTERLVSCQACGPSSSLSSDDGQQEPGIEKRRLVQRVHAAAANVPFVSTETWSKEGEEYTRSSDGTTGSNSDAHANELIADRCVNIDYGQSEAEFGAEVVNNYLDSTRSYHRIDASSDSSPDPAILRLEGDLLSHERGDFWQAAEKQVVSNSRSFSVSQLDKRLQESPASSGNAEEVAGKTNSSGAATDILDTIEGTGPFTVINQFETNFRIADLDSGTCEHRDSDVTRTTPRATEFWKIVNNDIEFLARNFNRAKEVAFPVLATLAEKVVSLRLWEDESIAPLCETPCPKAFYPELSGLDLLAADVRVLKGYINSNLSWLLAWHIPLEPVYEPEMIAEYFNRRPQVLLFRVLQVSAVFGSVIIQLEIEKVLNLNHGPAKQITGNEVQRSNRQAELLKEALVKLGPTFIKAGQSLSTRPDLVGAETAKILAELQDNLPPFPTPQAITIIERELGQPLNEVFSYLSEKPVAAASFGQVYKGRTLNGQEVAVKVQRPNLLHSIALDIYILRMALAAIKKIAKRRNDLKRYADEVGLGLFGELDYMQEAANAAQFQAAHSKLTFLEVPNVITSLSTRRVLTMEWIDGDRPVDLLVTAQRQVPDGDVCSREQKLKAKRRLFSLVNKGVEASLVQLLDTGILHADPHGGNLLYKQNDQMVLLDFGLLCRMEKKHQLAMIASVVHIVNAEWKNFVDDLADMEVLPYDIDRIAIALEMEEALSDAVPKSGIPDIKFSKVLGKVLAIAFKHHFKMPPYFVLVLRSIASLEGLALAADPDFKVFAATYPFVLQRLLTDKTVHLRNIFISLVLNERKEFRWDRLASFAILARQHTMKCVALETGVEIQDLAASEHDAKSTNLDLVPRLLKFLVSKDGVILRRLILEADTPALAHVFNSSKAAAFRRHAATAMGDAFYQFGQNVLKKHTNIELQDSLESSQSLTLPSKEWPQESSSDSETSLKNEAKRILNCSDTLDGSLLKSRHLWFLLRTAVARLKKTPLLMLNTGWSCFSMLCYAVFQAAHRLLRAPFDRYLKSNPATGQRNDNQLILA